jgi:uncharacterized protein YbjT (DUF2867 family)
MQKTALILGATGLVGSHLLDLLIKDPEYKQVLVVARKQVTNSSPKVVQLILNFDNLAEYKEKIKADDVFCCLGTTMKKAGTKEKFYQVDYTYIFNIARIVSENQADSFNLVTAMGADKNSAFFYNKVKGEIEEAVSTLRFKQINIFRPSMILGNRKESRPLEKAGQIVASLLSFVFVGPLKKYKAIDSQVIAKGMLKAVRLKVSGIKIYNSDEIAKLGQ